MVMLSNAGLTVSGTLTIPGIGQVMLSGSIDTQGNFNLKGTVTVTIAGFSASATITLTNAGLSVQVSLNTLFMGLRPQLAGQISPNGTVSLDGTAQVALDTVRFGPLPLALAFHLDNQGLRAHVAGNVNWTVHQATLTFTLQGSFAIDLVVRSDGTFNSAGNFMAQECANTTCGPVVVPYSIDNHMFVIHAPQPFGDVVMQYPMGGTGVQVVGAFPTAVQVDNVGTFSFFPGDAAVRLPHDDTFTAATPMTGAADGTNLRLADTSAPGFRSVPLDQTLGTVVGSWEPFGTFATAWSRTGPATPEKESRQPAPAAGVEGNSPSTKPAALPPTGDRPVAGSDHVMDVVLTDWVSMLSQDRLVDEMIRALIG